MKSTICTGTTTAIKRYPLEVQVLDKPVVIGDDGYKVISFYFEECDGESINNGSHAMETLYLEILKNDGDESKFVMANIEYYFDIWSDGGIKTMESVDICINNNYGSKPHLEPFESQSDTNGITDDDIACFMILFCDGSIISTHQCANDINLYPEAETNLRKHAIMQCISNFDYDDIYNSAANVYCAECVLRSCLIDDWNSNNCKEHTPQPLSKRKNSSDKCVRCKNDL